MLVADPSLARGRDWFGSTMIAMWIFYYRRDHAGAHGARGDAEEEEEVEGLDVIREAEDLKHMFEDKGQALSIRVEAATRESLRRTLQAKGVKCAAEVLHFTCHGLPDGFLALEDSAGQLDRLSASDLEAMLDRDRMPDVVFVSACFSHPIGDIFVQAGVKHVVAVRRDSRVADQVGRDFAKFFYDRLVTGDTVQDAFDYAQQCIQLTPGKDDAWRTRQEKKFLLLPKQGVDHAVPVFDPGRVGEVRDETPPPTINSCRRITSRAIGRKVITQRIVQVLAAQSLPSAQPRQAAPSRWLTICGAEGIGKTTCAIAACNFLSKRRHCKGVCYVPLVRDSGARGVLRGGSEARATLVEAFCTSGPRALCAADSEPTLFAGLNAVTSEYEAYPGNLIVLLDGCEQISVLVRPDDADAQWSAVLKSTEEILPEALYKYPSINRKFSERDLARLRAVYERIAGSGQGRAQKPVRDVVKAFAAWLEASTASLLSNSEYWNQGVIFGLVSKEQVNEILLSRSSGTFLIRISESVPGNLAVAYVVAAPCGSSRRVVHSLVVPGPDGGVSLEFRNGRKRFESLGAFLLAHDIFCHLWPDRNKKEVLQAVFSSMAVSSAATSFSASHGRLPSASAMNSPRSLASVS
ncbi:Signal transducer and activator of transcription A [Hondaea fermentalgiana]|uniref:Signal transducer and activator of transcription A n=1 Tax=Hondaea fermentalgiana TaxID=2315210 RepID=A0A2R5GUF0_9STRA|nr:Signal transducer and activator of transcription A [Hondaea fermentalgiana]|eukprot:GBG32001.1 Signal transducer and activator of transcription A [Hondaea fermentalgiana]